MKEIKRKQPKRLWEKGEELNELVHQFTVGNDPLIDLNLVYFDAVGSAAHARMLHKTKLLTDDEVVKLLKGLAKIVTLNRTGQFTIPEELEDCHTAIENFLTEQYGEPGKKIHTGRSRNDQVLLAMRLYVREKIVEILEQLGHCAKNLFTRAEELSKLPLPGYTHFQAAMPASVRMWLQAFAESLIDLIEDGVSLIERINFSPLGAASGFGSSLPLERKYTATLLGFARPQRNPIDIQNSRGRAELKFIRWCVDISAAIEKFAWDMLLYTSREFAFFRLPRSLTTGSSIMPQKHNPDVLELLRARAAKVRAAELELLWVIAKLPSNYHRDFQYTKEPVIRSAQQIVESLPILDEVIKSFTPNPARLEEAMTDEIYATYDLYRQVKQGSSFRDAYRETAKKVEANQIKKEELQCDFAVIDRQLIAEAKEASNQLISQNKKIKGLRTMLAKVESRVFKTS